MKKKLRRKLPGDPDFRAESVESMIRVNHAGEYGAQQIYKGQLAVLGSHPEIGPLLRHMAEQEDVHLKYFENQLIERQIRPTALQPFWHIAGYALGYVTARMGVSAAMACTVAVEAVISGHYGSQISQLGEEEKSLRKHIARFKEEEEEHHDIGIDNDAEQAPAYSLLSGVISNGSRLAIRIAKKI